MRNLLLFIGFAFLISCNEPYPAREKWTYQIKNELSIPIYLDIYNDNIIYKSDTIFAKSAILSEDYSMGFKLPVFLFSGDSIKVVFNNEKYKWDDKTKWKEPHSMYEPNNYSGNPNNTRIYTFTQEDYDNALPM